MQIKRQVEPALAHLLGNLTLTGMLLATEHAQLPNNANASMLSLRTATSQLAFTVMPITQEVTMNTDDGQPKPISLDPDADGLVDEGEIAVPWRGWIVGVDWQYDEELTERLVLALTVYTRNGVAVTRHMVGATELAEHENWPTNEEVVAFLSRDTSSLDDAVGLAEKTLRS